MKHRQSGTLAAILVGLALAAWYPTRALSAEEDHWDKRTEFTPIDTIALNSCNDAEPVEITAIVTTKTWSRIVRETLSFRQTVKLTGTGIGQVSGATYRIEEKNHIRMMDGLPLPFVTSQKATLKLRGAGVPDQIIRIENRFEVDADGNVITDFLDFDIVCR